MYHTFVIYKNYELAISLDEVDILPGQVHDWTETLAASHLVTVANKQIRARQ